MIRWRIYQNEYREWHEDNQWLIDIDYNDSPLLSHLAGGNNVVPTVDRRWINGKVDEQKEMMMDIVIHKHYLEHHFKNPFIVKEILGL